MTLRIRRCDSPRELMVGGELDIATVPELKRVLGTMSSTGDITLDLEFLRFSDEAGLQLLLSTAQRLEGSLILRSPPETLVRLLNFLAPSTPKNVVIEVPKDGVTRAKPGSSTA